MNENEILYVDDEELNLLLFKSTFSNHYTIYTALSAEEGIKILRDHPIKVVVTDQNMPRTSGVEFLQGIVEDFPDTVRLILTGNNETREIIRAINHGKIYHYIAKPWKAEEVKLVIERAIEHYNLKCHNRQLVESLESKNQQLTKAIDELELFLYRSSHDLRGPLTTQMGLLRLTKMGSGPNEVNECLTRLEECTFNLANTLDKISKVNVFNIDTVKLYDVDINKVLDEVFSIYQEKITNQGIDIRIASCETEKFVSNPELIKILFENLIENAIKFSDPNKESFIHAKVQSTGSALQIELIDNGIGIEGKYLQRIFDPFFKVNNGHGNGLGLYVVQKVVKKLGGTISLSSIHKVETKVTLTLPCSVFEESRLKYAS